MRSFKHFLDRPIYSLTEMIDMGDSSLSMRSNESSRQKLTEALLEAQPCDILTPSLSDILGMFRSDNEN